MTPINPTDIRYIKLGSVGESMAIPVASSSPREKPQVEPSGVQAASRSYR